MGAAVLCPDRKLRMLCGTGSRIQFQCLLARHQLRRARERKATWLKGSTSMSRTMRPWPAPVITALGGADNVVAVTHLQ